MNHLVPRREIPVPFWRLSTEALYKIDGRDYRLMESDIDVHTFQPNVGLGELLHVSHADFYVKFNDGSIAIDNGFYGRRRAVLRNIDRDFNIGDLAPKEQDRVMFTYLLCQSFEMHLGEDERGESDRPINRGKRCLTWLLPKMQKEIVEIHNEGARRGSELRFSGKPPSPRQFSRDWLRYEDTRDPAAFARLYWGSRTRRKVIDPLEYRIRVKLQREFASPKRPSKANLLKRYEGVIKRVNRGLERQKLSVLVPVSRKTFEKGIDALDKFWVSVHRDGEKAALAKHGTGSGGFGLFRPLERVEFDEWKMDLMTLLIELRLWERLSVMQKKLVEVARLWVTVAMDTATRCVLAFKVHARAPCGATAVEALHLALSDKSGMAAYLGAGSSYVYTGRAETVLPDNGASFRSQEFFNAVTDSGGELLLPKAGTPQARAHLERSFRTFSSQSLHWFSGRTFSNVVEKGDADPRTQASLMADSVAKGLFRYLVDEYHHTPHSGLGGETPHDCWMRLTRRYKVQPPPGRDEMRAIFGIKFRRTVTKLGIRFMGFQFNSREIQDLFGEEVTISVDIYDLCCISFWNGKTWMPLLPEHPIPSGMTVYEVEHAMREYEGQFADRSALHWDYVADAAAALRDLGITADKMVNPLSDRTTEAVRLDRLDRERFGFSIRASDRSPIHKPNRILDLTKTKITDSTVYADPPGYVDDPAPTLDWDRYTLKDEEKQISDCDHASEIQAEDNGPVSYDDSTDDEIGFD